MRLTIENFFSDLIFYPEKADKQDYEKSLCLSVALGVLTLGVLHLAVGIGWMVKRSYIWVTNKLSDIEVRTENVKKDSFKEKLYLRKGKDVSIDENTQTVTFWKNPVSWRDLFPHINILNTGTYKIQNTTITLRDPGIAQKITRNMGASVEDLLFPLKKSLSEATDKGNKKIQIKDMTTGEAIIDGDYCKIALNFANEKHAGGTPGIYLESDTIKKTGGGMAHAQEESLTATTNLYLSLAKGIPNTLKDKRNYYNDGGFDSRNTAYLSDNQLFGIQKGDFYTTLFLEKPHDVSFVTSAAYCYSKQGAISVNEGSDAYLDATNRIRTHLYAAALKAMELKEKNNETRVELILGAFGCGEFAPSNAKAYATMIATIYKKELPYFVVFFDLITFAIPKMGNTQPTNSFVRNFDAFSEVFKTSA